MKKLLIVLTIILFADSCNTHKKAQSSSHTLKSDTTHTATRTVKATGDDTLVATGRKRSREVSETATTVYERGISDPVNDPFTITASFRVDSTVKGGDTIRLVSQENEQIKFEVYLDKKTGQTVASIKGKGGKAKATPFDKITITNAKVTKTADSQGKVLAGSSRTLEAAAVDSSAGHQLKQDAASKTELTRKQTGLAWTVAGIIIVAGLAVTGIVLWKRRAA